MSVPSKKTASKKEFILQKAALMFREKGFAATSMRNLADSVGIEAASLYNHIRSKNEMLESVCFAVANRFNMHMSLMEADHQKSIVRIETLLRFHINQMIEHFTEVTVSDREWKHLKNPALTNFHHQRRMYRKRFAAIIEKGIKSGEIKKIDAATAVIIMLHAVNGIESWHRSKAKINAQELENNMVLILTNGLRKQE
ncbi:MAG: TetR/AcrR family transcriptional regulator [Chitinophagaceae bacterium]|nr:MAG: TetR/AcrR family transcriptional regulator [Chitinophagaceae bacterium]